MSESMTEDVIANVRETFSLYDKDNDGAIQTREIIAALRSLGFNPTESLVRELIEEFDPDGDGMIEFAPFLDLVQRVGHDGESEEDLEEAFRVFDPMGSGYISAVDLRQVMTNMGEKLTEEEADDMIAYADNKGTGEINYRELIHIMVTDGDK